MEICFDHTIFWTMSEMVTFIEYTFNHVKSIYIFHHFYISSYTDLWVQIYNIGSNLNINS